MKSIKFLLTFSLAITLLLVPQPSKAYNPTVFSQSCVLIDQITSFISTANNTNQVFFANASVLDKVAVWVKPGIGDQAKAKVKVLNATSLAVAGTVAEKNILVTRNSRSTTVDFTDVEIPNGIYVLKVEALHANEPVLWEYTETPCYRGGHAIISSQSYDNRDFGFAVSTKVTAPNPLPNAPAPAGANPNVAEPEPQADEAPPADNPAPADNTVTEDTTSDNTTDIVTDTTTSKDTSTQSTGAQSNETQTQNAEVTALEKKYLTDKEQRELVAWILEDFEKNKTKGAFGLGGMVGSILSWPVVITIGALIILFLIIIIVNKIKKPKKTDKTNS